MSRKIQGRTSSFRPLLLLGAILTTVFAGTGRAQSVPYERSFPQSKAVVEKRIKELEMSAGRLPVLDGFTVPGDRPLSRFQRGYYQCVTQVIPTPSGASMVRVSATITAWYTDPVSGKSDYQVLPSNGRLENDVLDRLQEALSDGAPSESANNRKSSMPHPKDNLDAATATLSAPMPGSPTPIAKSAGSAASAGSTFKLGDPLGADHVASLATQKAIVDKHTEEQEKEANALEEILRNQAHPSNLAAVTKAETPVLTSPNQGAKVSFLAAAEDEFEILDSNPNWVHVRIPVFPGVGYGVRVSKCRTVRQTPGPLRVTRRRNPRSSPLSSTRSHFKCKASRSRPFPGLGRRFEEKRSALSRFRRPGTAQPTPGHRRNSYSLNLCSIRRMAMLPRDQPVSMESSLFSIPRMAE